MAWYSSTKSLLMIHREDNAGALWSTKKHAVVYVWVGCIEDILLLGDLGRVRIPKTAGIFFLTEMVSISKLDTVTTPLETDTSLSSQNLQRLN